MGSTTESNLKLSVALHDIRSLHNVGSIFRTADGAGFDHLYISGYTGAPPDPRIAKVALGAQESVSFCQSKQLDQLLDKLSNSYVVALEQSDSSVPYWDLQLPASGEITLVVGGELLGVPQELTARADRLIEIPMAGSKRSLNVSCAFSVVAYELARQTKRVSESNLVSRNPKQQPRSGVLTNGQTTGETPLKRTL